MKTKLCKTCCKRRKIRNFFRSNYSRDGFQHECKLCCHHRYRAHKLKCQQLGVLTFSQRTSRRLKLEVLSAYGNGKPPECDCCGEKQIEFLSIDHVNGNGNEHRRKIRTQGTGFYMWLKRNKFPSGFRVLCHNCNQAIGFMGYCPHKKETPFLPPPRLREIASEIRSKITKALISSNTGTINSIAIRAGLSHETARRYLPEFKVSGLWIQPPKIKTHCKRGHPMEGSNIAIGSHGRFCKACRRIYGINQRRKLKEAA